MRTTHRQFVTWYAAVLGGGVGALMLLNLWVDPYMAFRLHDTAEFNQRKDTSNTRHTKGEMIRHGGWQVLLIGDSRVQVGLDPAAPPFADRATYNLGLPGASMVELEDVVTYALERNPQLELIVLMVGLEGFSTQLGISSDFDLSRFNAELDRVEYLGMLLLGVTTTEESIKVLRWDAGEQALTYDLQGMVRRSLKRKGTSHHAMFAEWVAAATGGLLGYDETRMQNLRRACRKIQQSDCRLILVTAPMHTVWLESCERNGWWPTLEEWKKQLTATVAALNAADPNNPIELWDFAGYWPYNREAVPPADQVDQPMRWHFEPTHFTPALGSEVLKRIFGEPTAQPFGRRMTPQSIDALVAEQRRERDAYVAPFGPEAD
jgi:hypothetical protein